MDLFAAQYTTQLDVRWMPALYGTIQNALHRPLRRTLRKVSAVLLLGAGLHLLLPEITWSTLCVATIGGSITLYLTLFTAITLIVRVRARERYGRLPAPVRVRFVRDGLDIAYASLAPRRVPYSFVNNWWNVPSSGSWTIVLGRHPIERFALSIDPTLLDEADRSWLQTILEQAHRRAHSAK